jgi:glycosyltransferase involved in cell wall biosynthesis
MLQLENNPQLHEHYRTEGRKQAETFSWQKTAEKTWHVIKVQQQAP